MFTVRVMGRQTPASVLAAQVSKPHMPSLDGLRALAVFLVIAYHFGFDSVPAALGVLIFFVLSGFLITTILLREWDKQGSVSLLSFYQRRTFRILPAFYIFWIIGTLSLVCRERPVPWHYSLSALAYLGDYFNAIVRPSASYVSHTWSLAVEEQFYLLWPLGFLWLARRNRQTVPILGGLILLLWVYRAKFYAMGWITSSYVYNAFDTRVDHLLIGCLLAILVANPRAKNIWNVVCRWPVLAWLNFGLILASSLFLSRYRASLEFTITPVLVSLFLVQVMVFASRGWQWLNWAPVRYLGRISYSLYLYQQITLHPARKLLAAMPVSVQFLAAALLTIVVASISYYAVEVPFMRLRSRVGRKRRSAVEFSPAATTVSLAPSPEGSC